MYQFQQNIKILKSKIKTWNKESFDNIFKEKVELDGKIKEVQIKGMQNGIIEEIWEKEKMLIHELSQREQ